ncbi:MAG: hydrogenase maturation protease [Streptosporangiaceae bacterium]
MTGKLLIAGVGNIFLGGDGFGVEVASRLAAAELPDWADVVDDYGIRGMHLAYDLANGYTAAILIDAAARGGVPGTIYLIEPDLSAADSAAGTDGMLGDNPVFNAHGMQPEVVLSMLGMLGSQAGPDRRLRAGQCRVRHRAQRAGSRGRRQGRPYCSRSHRRRSRIWRRATTSREGAGICVSGFPVR